MSLLAQFSEILSALAAVGFIGATLWLLSRPRQRLAVLMPSPRWLILAAAGTAAWCTALATWQPGASQVLVIQALRDLSWLGWLAATFWSPQAPMSQPLRMILRLLVTIGAIALVLGGAAHLRSGDVAGWIGPSLAVGAMIVAIGGLLITDGGVRRAGSGLRMPVMTVAGGFAMIWAYELNVQLIGALTGKPASTLILLLPAVALLVLPTFVVAAMDVGRERIRLSRAAAMRAILLVGGAAYLTLIGLAGAVARFGGGDYGELAQGLFLIVALGLGALLFLSARARAWLSVTISKHVFEHRYDYRAEWMRFTATLAQSDDDSEDGRDLHRRVAKGLAELTGSPGALLMLPDAVGGFRIADAWRWPGGPDAEVAPLPLRSAFMLQETQHIVELDAQRREGGEGDSELAMPDWLLADPRAWVVVPVLHFQRMIAVVVLHRPPVSRALDWEDLDVLRIAGRQAASYLAEAQGQQALSEAKRFDEFNRRFAFIMHDIKNLASQLALLARNAERHAEKPEFRADMIATLKGSASRLSDLLARLSPRERGKAAEPARVVVEPLINAIVAATKARRTLFAGCQAGLAAWGDAASIRQILQHLVDNAIDASEPEAPVQLVAVAESGRVRIDVIDQGKGMTRAFVRNELFKPFVSTKDGGFGLGAFEALQLAQSMGGTIDVVSEPGAGSNFTLWLPLAESERGHGTDDYLRKAATQ
ncbi:PEP-CTERM system histidine kinase PrsK [Sphingopyxis sp. XHP0097]|uniref:histidine kinase n=1 Tax=Sphingopyxis jiangsuensis TaxID=2871171 RepID=A0ABS7MDF5_9SPHN|nr:XrtA/PEP-CTERM system histidine kinase PrsK [Sphingopyxis jiangsuensis]MBY4636973.1 PEP-CTERM system histidine kinase PrsK [Sphingopyxis jiangsuensis]